MSLLSEYKGFGFIGGADIGVQSLRMQQIQPLLTTGSAVGFSPEITLENNITYAVSDCALEVGGAGYPFGTVKHNFSANKSTYTRGPNVSYPYNQQTAILASPILNGWYIDGYGYSNSDSTWYTNNNGASYSTTNLSSEKPQTTFWEPGYGGYWDGTNFAFVSNTVQTRNTTNGTTFSTIPSGFQSVFFAGNNRSNYSGYWFGRITSPSIGYAYKTSAAGGSTQVTGYYITAMSPNGRYLQRIQTSGSYNEEYSTDGGASWTTFPTQSPYGGQATGMTFTQARRFCSNSGENFIMAYYGLIFGYNFSTSTWDICAALDDSLGIGSLVKPRNFLIQGVESLLVSAGGYSGPTPYFIVDMPKLLT